MKSPGHTFCSRITKFYIQLDKTNCRNYLLLLSCHSKNEVRVCIWKKRKISSWNGRHFVFRLSASLFLNDKVVFALIKVCKKKILKLLIWFRCKQIFKSILLKIAAILFLEFMQSIFFLFYSWYNRDKVLFAKNLVKIASFLKKLGFFDQVWFGKNT